MPRPAPQDGVGAEAKKLRSGSRIGHQPLIDAERVGMVLHDEVIQKIYAIGLGLDAAVQSLDHADMRQTRSQLLVAHDQINTLIREIREYVIDLEGTPTTPESLQVVLARLGQQLNLNLKLNVSREAETAFSPEQKQQILLIVREALTNVVRHASTDAANLTLRSEGTCWILSIEDSGVGFNPLARASSSGFGLRHMLTRARLVGGTLTIQSRPGEGTRIRLAFHSSTLTSPKGGTTWNAVSRSA